MAERDAKDSEAPPLRKPPAPAVTRSIDEQLDEALADSFPASDPVSFVTSQTEEDWADAPDRKPSQGDS